MKQIALILTLLLAAAGASAQEVFIGADFDTRFDNREHSDCNIDDSHTFFSKEGTPGPGAPLSPARRILQQGEKLDFLLKTLLRASYLENGMIRTS